jgi:hypothetical protein
MQRGNGRKGPLLNLTVAISLLPNRPGQSLASARLLETGSPFRPLFGSELKSFIDKEQKLWRPLVKKYGPN